MELDFGFIALSGGLRTGEAVEEVLDDGGVDGRILLKRGRGGGEGTAGRSGRCGGVEGSGTTVAGDGEVALGRGGGAGGAGGGFKEIRHFTGDLVDFGFKGWGEVDRGWGSGAVEGSVRCEGERGVGLEVWLVEKVGRKEERKTYSWWWAHGLHSPSNASLLKIL